VSGLLLLLVVPPVAGAVMWVTFTPHGAHSRVRAETHDQVDARREPVQR
jgi:hypothetical protein